MPEPLSPERLEEIRERADSATPAPWGVGNSTEIALDVDQTSPGCFSYTVKLASVVEDEDRQDDVYYLNPATQPRTVAAAEDDARFIAHSRQDVDDLLAEVNRLRRGMLDLYARWIQRAIDNGDYYNRTAEKYENGKAVAFDAAAEEIRSLIGEEVPADV